MGPRPNAITITWMTFHLKVRGSWNPEAIA